ncbi:Similar to adgra3: Adhesion G protein-coupled receptor A3 (Danio rerio) [Cotesia congregata]|uniref:Similar to adgra3: Adhesion G protein-coupled receptor A3 (Danio rerio) n=1 Tax=Cotesia congregata TaxID=51543 RepID=A0A8J2HGL0_COTCN|nr:Similar to adgra3: Adhesion G protein-coupled receptor A3 (Danio rerio) [Cotesia congregata]
MKKNVVNKKIILQFYSSTEILSVHNFNESINYSYRFSKFKRSINSNFGIFRGLSNLRCLDISNNKLVIIWPGAFDGLRSLKKFLAIDNLLQLVNFQDFENSTTLETIDLSNNKLIYESLKFFYQPGLKEL